MNPPSHDTALLLADLASFGDFGGSTNWSVHVSREPMAPDNVVTVYDTGGTAGPLIDLRHPTVQVRVRSSIYDAGWRKINEAFEALSRPISVSVPDATIIGWVPTSDAAFIGRDDHDRALFTANFEIMRDGAETA